MSRGVFAITDLVEEVRRLNPGAAPMILTMGPDTFRAVAGEVVQHEGVVLNASTREVDMGGILLRAVHG